MPMSAESSGVLPTTADFITIWLKYPNCCRVVTAWAGKSADRKEEAMAFVDTFKTLRVGAGLNITKVAKAASLSADTISKIERHINCKKESCHAALNALNDLYYNPKGRPLNVDSLISDKPSTGEGRPGPGEEETE